MEGKRVVYSVQKSETAIGTILCMLPAIKENKESSITVSGVLIEEEDGKLKQIAAWRLIRIAKKNEGKLQGGYNRSQDGI